MPRLALLVVSAVAVVAVPSAAQAKTYYLDSYDKVAKLYTVPLPTEKLAKGVPYKIQVRGTFSLFSAEEYRGEFCGTPDPKPIYPSKGRVNGPVSADPEFLYGDTTRNCARRASPLIPSSFEIKTNTRYVNRKPIGFEGLTGPKANHLYTYAVVGSGKVARFRLLDELKKDNYGRLRIAISRATAANCANKGYVNWKYADEATCTTATRRAVAR